jgi:Xaa-Pro dipeptidase
LRTQHQAYIPICASGNRSAILHYNANSKQIVNGDLVLVDAGAEYFGYASDITRTYPANGKFSPEQKTVYEMVLRTQQTVLNAMRPGVKWSELTLLSRQSICSELLQAGFVTGTVDELISKGVCSLFFPHGLGHHLGLDVHDPGPISSLVLEANMVLTIEPGIYFNRAFIEKGMNNPVQKQHLVTEKIAQFLDMNFGGIRIEDDVIVTDSGVEIISLVPKTIGDIESTMKHSISL